MRVYEKTHCKRGHPLTGPHVRLIRSDGYTKRRCTICVGIRKRRFLIRRVRARLAAQ